MSASRKEATGKAGTRFRSSASFGKRMEYAAIAELLRRGFDAYVPLVDDQGIDLVIRGARGGKPVYADVQLKARSEAAKQPATFSAMNVQNPRPNYFYIFWSEAAKTSWIFPTEDLVREATQNKSGANQGRYSLVLCNVHADGKVMPRPRFAGYQGERGFGRLAAVVPPWSPPEISD